MKTTSVPSESSGHASTTQRQASNENIPHKRTLTPTSSGTATPTTEDFDRDAEVLFDAADLNDRFPSPHDRFPSPKRFRSSDNQYSKLPEEETRCEFLPAKSAAWELQRGARTIVLSVLAVAVLLNEGVITEKDLEIYQGDLKDFNRGPTDPISGILSATHATVGGVVMGLTDYPIEITKMVRSDKEISASLAREFALDSNKGVSRIIGTSLKAPMEFTMGISKGFENLPRLYGDKEVREQKKVTGFVSGLEVAGKGLGMGLYDGISGLFVRPVKGAREGGVGGFFKGVGMGIGGVVCKPVAGAVGLPAYAFKGVHEEVKRKMGRFDVEKEMLLRKGEAELETCEIEVRRLVVGMWYQMELNGMGEGVREKQA